MHARLSGSVGQVWRPEQISVCISLSLCDEISTTDQTSLLKSVAMLHLRNSTSYLMINAMYFLAWGKNLRPVVEITVLSFMGSTSLAASTVVLGLTLYLGRWKSGRSMMVQVCRDIYENIILCTNHLFPRIFHGSILQVTTDRRNPWRREGRCTCSVTTVKRP